ncbi:hypothetical protein MHU86_17664 [Fragilaria crotonensis]|nr:hypothetical protein MHU86_17664 [Fragilaria crotonensis]
MNEQNDMTRKSVEEMLLLWRLQQQQQQRLPLLSTPLAHQELYPRRQQNLESHHLRNLNASASLSLAAALNPGWMPHGLALTPTRPQLGSSMTLTESLLRNFPQSISNLQQQQQQQLQLQRQRQQQQQQQLAMQLISRSGLQLRQPAVESLSSLPTLPDSQLPTSLSTTTTVGSGAVTSGEMSNRDPVHAFASRLHEILSNPEYSAYISWLPHGRAWKILDKTGFERNVIPNHFRHARYASFMRQVNGWGFKRITEGPDHNAYFHEYFLRDHPQLCWKIQRMPHSQSMASQARRKPSSRSTTESAPLLASSAKRTTSSSPLSPSKESDPGKEHEGAGV